MTVTILEPTEYNFSIANVDFVFFDYYPSPFVEDHARLYTFCDHQLVRESIYKFRDGKEQSWPTIILQKLLVKEVISLIASKQIDPKTDNWALAFPPASSKDSNTARFKEFTTNICGLFTKLQNSFDHIEIVKEKEPKYINDKLNPKEHTTWDLDQDLKFDIDFFKGKNIILFDDVVTTGKTMYDFIIKLKQLEANPVLCLSILYTPKVYGESLFVKKVRVVKDDTKS